MTTGYISMKFGTDVYDAHNKIYYLLCMFHSLCAGADCLGFPKQIRRHYADGG